MSNFDLVKKTSGDLYYIPLANYIANKWSLPTYSSANPLTFAEAFEAVFDTTIAGKIWSFQYSFGWENDETIYAMGCGQSNVVFDSIDRITNITAEILTLNNYDMLSTILWSNHLVVVAGTATRTGDTLAPSLIIWASATLPYRSQDGTIATAVTIYNNGVSQVLTTNYTLSVNAQGETVVTAVTAFTGPVTADYTYVRTAQDVMWVENKTIQVQRTGYFFKSCEYQDKNDLVTPFRRDYVYFTECKLDGELVQRYYKQGDSFEWSEVSFLADTGVAIVITRKAATTGILL